MQVAYKDNRLERILVGVNALAAVGVAATFVILFGGFERPLLPETVLYAAQVVFLCPHLF